MFSEQKLSHINCQIVQRSPHTHTRAGCISIHAGLDARNDDKMMCTRCRSCRHRAQTLKYGGGGGGGGRRDVTQSVIFRDISKGFRPPRPKRVAGGRAPRRAHASWLSVFPRTKGFGDRIRYDIVSGGKTRKKKNKKNKKPAHVPVIRLSSAPSSAFSRVSPERVLSAAAPVPDIIFDFDLTTGNNNVFQLSEVRARGESPEPRGRFTRPDGHNVYITPSDALPRPMNIVGSNVRARR